MHWAWDKLAAKTMELNVGQSSSLPGLGERTTRVDAVSNTISRLLDNPPFCYPNALSRIAQDAARSRWQDLLGDVQ